MQAVGAPEHHLTDAVDRDVDRRGIGRAVTLGRPGGLAGLLVEGHEGRALAARFDQELAPRDHGRRRKAVGRQLRFELLREVVLPDDHRVWQLTRLVCN